MAFTYELADLTDTTATGHALAVVRYRLGDTVEKKAIFQDEEIQYQLAASDNAIGAALAELISGILARISRQPDMTADWLTISLRRSSDHWRLLLRDLRNEYHLGAAPVEL